VRFEHRDFLSFKWRWLGSNIPSPTRSTL
jgi:hypothetical protein